MQATLDPRVREPEPASDQTWQAELRKLVAPVSTFLRPKTNVTTVVVTPSTVPPTQATSVASTVSSTSPASTITSGTLASSQTTTNTLTVDRTRAVYLDDGCVILPSMTIPQHEVAIWNDIRDRIEHEIVECFRLECHLEFYMVADKKGRIGPCILLTCWDDSISVNTSKMASARKALQKKARKLYNLHPDRCRFPCKVVIDKISLAARSAASGDATFQVMATSQVDSEESLVSLPISCTPSTDSACTLGGLVRVCSRVFGLTVAHPFATRISPPGAVSQSEHSSPVVSNSSEVESDADQSDSDSLFDGYDCMSEVGFLETSEESDTHQTEGGRAPDIEQQSLVPGPNETKARQENNERFTYEIGALFTSSQDVRTTIVDSHVDNDWALIELNASILPRPNSYRTGHQNLLTRLRNPSTDIMAQGSNASILTHSESPVEATVGLTDVRLNIDGLHLSVTQLVLSNPLACGTSGAWVVQDDCVVGCIVAVRKLLPIAYMVPMKRILDDISKHFESEDVSITDVEIQDHEPTSVEFPQVDDAERASIVVREHMTYVDGGTSEYEDEVSQRKNISSSDYKASKLRSYEPQKFSSTIGDVFNVYFSPPRHSSGQMSDEDHDALLPAPSVTQAETLVNESSVNRPPTTNRAEPTSLSWPRRLAKTISQLVQSSTGPRGTNQKYLNYQLLGPPEHETSAADRGHIPGRLAEVRSDDTVIEMQVFGSQVHSQTRDRIPAKREYTDTRPDRTDPSANVDALSGYACQVIRYSVQPTKYLSRAQEKAQQAAQREGVVVQMLEVPSDRTTIGSSAQELDPIPLLDRSSKSTQSENRPFVNYFFPKQNDVPNWAPLLMRRLSLFILALCALSLAAIQESFRQVSLRHQDENGFGPVFTGTYQYLYSIRLLTTIVTVFYSVLYSAMDLRFRRLEPYYQLSRPHGDSIDRTLSLDYRTGFQTVLPVKAVLLRNWTIIASTTGNLVVSLVAVTTQVMSRTYKHDSETGRWEMGVDPVWSQVCTVSYLVVAVTLVFLFVQQSRRKSGLLENPQGIASILSMITGSPILDDFRGHKFDSQDDIDKKLRFRNYRLYQSSIWPGKLVPYKIATKSYEDRWTWEQVKPFRTYLHFGFVIWFVTFLATCLAFFSMASWRPVVPTVLPPWTPFLLAAVLRYVWPAIAARTQLTEPFHQLYKGLARPEDSLTLDYGGTTVGSILATASVKHHWLVFGIAACSISNDVLLVTAGVFLMTTGKSLTAADMDASESNNNKSRAFFWIPFMLCMTALVLVAATTIGILWRNIRKRRFYAHVPTTIGAVLACICTSKMLFDFVGTEHMISRHVESILKRGAKMYRYGQFQGEEGQTHLAIDEDWWVFDPGRFRSDITNVDDEYL